MPVNLAAPALLVAVALASTLVKALSQASLYLETSVCNLLGMLSLYQLLVVMSYQSKPDVLIDATTLEPPSFSAADQMSSMMVW